MSVKFKFRSAPEFDSIDLSGRSSISIGELIPEIIKRKRIKLSPDFDLVFSDADTGREYLDESNPVSNGSSVIIKRVPAGSGRSLLRIQDVAAMDLVTRSSDPTHKAINLLDTAQRHDTSGLNCDNVEIEDSLSHPDVPLFGQTPEMGNSTEFIISFNSTSDVKSRATADASCQLERRTPPENHLQEDINSSLEMKCSLCDSLFKDAVTIPCCQRSFCEKCITEALKDRARCPVCNTAKCRVDDLVPDALLRRSVELFLNSKDDFAGYASDCESGVHGNDVSKQAVMRSELKTEVSSQFSTRRNNACTGEHRCYICGSTGHFDRDCPMKVYSIPMYGHEVLPGFCPPYWQGVPVPQAGPFMNHYGAPGVITYAMAPLTPFPASAYGPTYNGYPAFKEWPCVGDKKSVGLYSRRELGTYHAQKSHNYGKRITDLPVANYELSSVNKNRRHRKHSDDDVSVNGRCRKNSRSFSGGQYQNDADKERLTPEVDYTSRNLHRPWEERHAHHYRGRPKHDERNGMLDTGCGRSHHWISERGSTRKRMKKDYEY